MKKIILAVLVLLGLQIQAQINVCDSLTVNGTQNYIIVEANNINTIIDVWNTTCPAGFCLATDTSTNTHYIQTGGMQDTIITCVTYAQNTCCVTWVWNGTFWSKMGSTVGIREIKPNTTTSGKIYDLLGREILDTRYFRFYLVPLGKMYIKNNKKCIRIK